MDLVKLVLTVFVGMSVMLFSISGLAQEAPYDLILEAAPTINYDPFSGQVEREGYRVRLDLSDSALLDRQAANELNRGRRFKIRIKASDNKGFSARNELQALAVNVTPLRNTRGFRRAFNEFSQEFVVSNNLAPRVFDFLIAVPSSIYADPGAYSLPVNVELVDIVSNSVLRTLESEIKVLVEVSLQSNIAGGSANRSSNSRFTMVNFGVLQTGESQKISLQVRANTAAKITLTSENEGRLKHTDDENLFVDYSINLDGESSELLEPLQLIRPVAKTIEGSAYPIEIKIGDVEASFAGNYRDIITVEVRPIFD